MAALLLMGAALLSLRRGAMTFVLLASLPVATVLGRVSRPVLLWVLGRWLRSRAARDPGGQQPGIADQDPVASLEALRAEPSVGAAFVERVTGWESAGLTLPLVGLCLILPLWLHLAVWAVLQAIARAGGTHHGSYWSNLGRFDQWIMMSILLVGAAHLALVISVLVFVGRLRRQSAFQPAFQPLFSRFMPLGWAVGFSAFPGIMFISAAGAGLLPMLFAGVTGVVFIPGILGRASRLFSHERELIAEVGEALRRA